MGKNINRRDFLKIAGTGLAVTTALTGCGPASKYTRREPYTQMPEYTYNGQSTYYATACRECPAGCGLVVRTIQGRAIKVEGNPNHPLNLGKTCARGQNAVHGLYNPDRVRTPLSKQSGQNNGSELTWEEASQIVKDLLKGGTKVAFLTGLTADHVFDLFHEVAVANNNRTPIRFSALEIFDNASTLRAAAERVYGEKRELVFDIANSDLVLNFGASFLETWQSPVSYTRAFTKMRRNPNGRGKLIHFESRMSQTAMKADEWIPVVPGTEGLVAKAIGKLVSEAITGTAGLAFADANISEIAALSGVEAATLERIATEFSTAKAPLALPPTNTAASIKGIDDMVAVLSLNVVISNQGKAGGVFFNAAPVLDLPSASAGSGDISGLIKSMEAGEIETLFVHGFNPAFEIPKSFGFEQALAKLTNLVSFSSFEDETTLKANYLFPDHSALESFGYQFVKQGTTTGVISGVQPVVAPYFNTMSTIDLFLSATNLAYADEVEFIQAKIAPLMDRTDGAYGDFDMPSFWAKFQQFGGWWKRTADAETVTPTNVIEQGLALATLPERKGFYLHTYLSPILAEAGANKPWLQEVPDPTTTVMWNNWLEVNPFTADELGLHNDEVVKVKSETGEIELPVLIYPAIRPDVVAIAFGQGHTNYGRYANGRGVNPADLFAAESNDAGAIVTGGIDVEIHHTGKTRPLSRLEGYTRLAQDAGEH